MKKLEKSLASLKKLSKLLPSSVSELYQREIAEYELAIVLIKTDGLTEENFEGFRSSSVRWDIFHSLEVGKGKWACPRCLAEIAPSRAPPFSRAEVHCSKCDQILTVRTGGGQGDLFNWKFVKL